MYSFGFSIGRRCGWFNVLKTIPGVTITVSDVYFSNHICFLVGAHFTGGSSEVIPKIQRWGTKYAGVQRSVGLVPIIEGIRLLVFWQ